MLFTCELCGHVGDAQSEPCYLFSHKKMLFLTCRKCRLTGIMKYKRIGHRINDRD